jgi:hypothetical protein
MRSAVSATTHNTSDAAARASDFGGCSFSFLDISFMAMTMWLAAALLTLNAAGL